MTTKLFAEIRIYFEPDSNQDLLHEHLRRAMNAAASVFEQEFPDLVTTSSAFLKVEAKDVRK